MNDALSSIPNTSKQQQQTPKKQKQAWLHTPGILALGRQFGISKVKVSLDYTVSSRLTWTT
jgi:hypothetical protein